MTPMLYEVRASVLLATVAAAAIAAEGGLGGEDREPTLADVPASYFTDLRSLGFEILYILGVWTTGAAGLQHSIDKLVSEATPTSSSSVRSSGTSA